MAYGDSKAEGYAMVATALNNILNPDPAKQAGATTADIAARAVADFAARTRNNYGWVLLTIGANDMSAMPAEAAFKASLLSIIDAAVARWPAVRVGVALPWRRGHAADSNTLAGWIQSVVAQRSAAFIGPDERVYLEAGDDGATYTTDGIHPNFGGYARAEALWRAAMGY